MASNIVDHFKVMIVIMLFYSFSITILSYALVDTDAIGYMSAYSNDGTADFETVATELEAGLTAQTDIPVLDVGSLIFYSGNILIDMLLNFLYAIPEMIGFLVYGIQSLLNIEGHLVELIEGFAFTIMTALYIMGVIQLLAGLRSGRIV